ncbi:pyocin knob domain-containing S74 family peptidase [Chitinophaga filiformis]|uniref:pyocin knob domain-containing S74 family peptidase n=1 Tax=Chitinophaga filiformis TaxID=104663 RepID=UPI001F41AB4E|nr:pyocin knob domain-containing S74 family peptidase [Chitinophaga filiformis]MCF6405526.1 pyocin knob domain-containing S74 family peptidase [Chitinophaga filiformis]
MNRRMKRLLLFLSISFVTSQVMAQKHVYQIRADSVRIYSGCDTAELIIENKTKDTLGFLYNKGNGRTEFRKLQLQTVGINGIAITGQDTLQLTPETLATVTARGSTTVSDITFNKASGNPSNGLTWVYNSDAWRIFVESPDDNPPGNMIFEARDNDNEGWIFRHDATNTGGAKTDLLSIGRDRLQYKGLDVLHMGNSSSLFVRGGVYETPPDWNTLVSNSFIGSVNMGTNAPVTDGTWWNLISTRHRNGLTDGNNYGMQIASGMAGTYLGRTYFRNQSNGTWTTWKEFWHSGNVTFGTKGANVALKTEPNGRLGLESWVRVGNNTGLTTPDSTALYHNGPACWVLKSAPGTTVTYLDLKTSDAVSRGSVYATNSNEIGFTGGSGTNWRLKTDASGNAVVTGQVTATGFVQSSLRSLKRDIQPFTASATGILKDAQVRTFVFKADSTNTKRIGFIADELPEEMSAAEHKGVDEANTVALLVKALQEMNARVEALEQEVKRLKSEKAAGKKDK